MAVVLALLLASMPAQAAELVLYELAGCPWCKLWDAEVGASYAKTPEGQRAPLRRVKLADASTSGVALAQPVTASPTFVLAHDGREIGRISGYPGADFFWGLLAELLAQLDKAPSDAGGIPQSGAPAAAAAR